MTNEEGYNGWSNYETWNVALWIDNDEGSYNYWRERSREILESDLSDDFAPPERKAVWLLADEIKDTIEDMSPLASEASLYSDLLGAALSEVDWREIAEHYLEEVQVEA